MKKIENLWQEAGIEQPLSLDGCPVRLNGKNRVNIVALGDVGTTVLMGLRLLGGDCISSIGIWDLSEANMRRLEQEMNQICYPFGQAELPVFSFSSFTISICSVWKKSSIPSWNSLVFAVSTSKSRRLFAATSVMTWSARLIG